MKLIEGYKNKNTAKKQPKEYATNWLDMATRALSSIGDDNQSSGIKVAVYRVIRYTNCRYNLSSNYDDDDVEELLKLWDVIVDLTGCITPREFMEVFPIDKYYDGEKYSCKDYFSTKEFMKEYEFELDKPINSKCKTVIDQRARTSTFLMEYCNNHIAILNVNIMLAISHKHTQMTGRDLFDDFLEQQGKPPLTKYHLHTDKDGNSFITGNDGSIFSVKKRYPKYIKVIK